MKTQTKLFSIILAFILVLAISASAITISSVSSSPSEIAPGQKATVSLILENNLGETAESINVKLDLKDLPVAPFGEGSEKNIEKIKSDDSKEIEFDVFVSADAKSQVYKIPVVISYKTKEAPFTKNDFISISVKAKPEISVSSSGYMVKGRENTINVNVVNSGLEDVKFLNVKISSGGVKLISAPESYIGNINSDDSDTVEFRAFIDENSGSQILLPVELSYRDSGNKEYTENFNLNLRAYTEKEAVELGLIQKSKTWIYLGVVIFVALIIIFFRVRKRRKREE